MSKNSEPLNAAEAAPYAATARAEGARDQIKLIARARSEAAKKPRRKSPGERAEEARLKALRQREVNPSSASGDAPFVKSSRLEQEYDELILKFAGLTSDSPNDATAEALKEHRRREKDALDRIEQGNEVSIPPH